MQIKSEFSSQGAGEKSFLNNYRVVSTPERTAYTLDTFTVSLRTMKNGQESRMGRALPVQAEDLRTNYCPPFSPKMSCNSEK